MNFGPADPELMGAPKQRRRAEIKHSVVTEIIEREKNSEGACEGDYTAGLYKRTVCFCEQRAETHNTVFEQTRKM